MYQNNVQSCGTIIASRELEERSRISQEATLKICPHMGGAAVARSIECQSGNEGALQ
jgi:hypothetical protein